MNLMTGGWRGLAIDGSKAIGIVVLVILCVLLSHEEPLRFIYTEF